MTINDVARLAGVSYQTVSRVINNKPNVSNSTRKRIQKIITETGYRPSPIARSLATARTATIGLVVPDISNPYFSALARGVEQVAYAHNYSVLLCNTGEDASRELDVLRTLDEMYVDGVIVCGLRQADAPLQQALDCFRAFVMINRRFANKVTPAINVDDVLGGYLATTHLLDLGHTAIGYIAGPTTSFSGVRRLKGYEKALAEAGIHRKPGWVQYCTPTVAGGETAVRLLNTNHPEISALFCYNDLVAIGAMRDCLAQGRRIPEDMAIVGYDDIMLATLVSPPLTTCHVPREEMGSQAVTMLLSCINDEANMCNEIIITPELVIRASTLGTNTAVTKP
ncbi:MAG: LacI family DNA-binding transcriptional regulator [Ardenticatenaceae bacterium]|nr:LacI family DNA-binding transcriptional regulator [Ardenticatenaceae bacterium]